MTFLPIVERELRAAARRKGTYWTRWGAALAVILVWLLLLSVSGRLATAELSKYLFIAFGVLSLIFCLGSGVFLTADCLSEEKREGTLGLLFLTDLHGYDVVLGKLIASSVHAFYAVLAVFPILGLPLLMGGVTMGEFCRVVFTVLVALLLSLALGMGVSAITREARQAMVGTLLALLILAGLAPALYWFWVTLTRAVPSRAILLVSPVQTFIAAFDKYYGAPRGPWAFWSSLILILSLAVGCLIFAAIALPRIWQEKTPVRRAQSSSSALDAEDRLGPELCAPGVKLRRRSNTLLDSNPILWLANRNRLAQPLAQGTVAVMSGLWLVFLIISIVRRADEAFVVALFIAYGLHQVIKSIAAAEATRMLNEGQRSGALELLLVTPLPEGNLLADLRTSFAQKLAGLRRLLVVINSMMCAVVLLVGERLHMPSETQAIFLELFLGGTLMVYMDLKAIEQAGHVMALRYRRQQRAILATMARIMVIPWLAVFLIVFIMIEQQGGRPWTLEVMLAVWFVVGTFNDVVVMSDAQTTLDKGIRNALSVSAVPWSPQIFANVTGSTLAQDRLPSPRTL